MIRVVIADDHPAIRLGLRAALAMDESLEVVADVESAEELFNALNTRSVDVVLTDFSMPGGDVADGLSMLDRIARHFSGVHVVLLTMVNHPSTVRAADRIGCMGMCDKSAPIAEAVHAVKLAARGQPFRSPAIAALLQAGGGVELVDDRLSPKEVEVVRLVAQGMGGDEIAVRLNRSPKTISRQKRSAMVRLGITTDDELAKYARRFGLS